MDEFYANPMLLNVTIFYVNEHTNSILTNQGEYNYI
jgi:hypothetical protein